MSLLPVAVYTLEVPCGGALIPAFSDFPATFRVTMAAIDPSAEVKGDIAEGGPRPRATLKIVRQPLSHEEDEDEEEYMRALIGGNSDSESEEDSESDDEVNGGPSDPAKSLKARKEAALKQLMDSAAEASDSDEEMKDTLNGVNGTAGANINKGKGKATSDDEDSENESDEELELEDFVLCTLDPEKNYQQALDITIGENEEVYFSVTGTHTVYLTGNYVIPQDDGHNHHHEVYDSDDDSEEDSDYDLSPDEDELDLEMEDSEDDELDALENPRVTEVDSDEDEAPKLVKAEEKKGKNKRSADELDESATLDDIISKAKEDEEPKLSKKQLKKLKKNNGEAAAVKTEGVSTPKSDKTDKKVQFAKNLEQGPTGSAEKSKVPGTPVPAKSDVPKMKVVNGVKIEDKKTGKGREAKSGDRVEMRYIGKIQDGPVFDSNKSGKPFSFKLGKGEVIKGWDIGVAGMKCEGERRLTIPPNLAYGKKADGKIPGNSTLVFDVKLLKIT